MPRILSLCRPLIFWKACSEVFRPERMDLHQTRRRRCYKCTRILSRSTVVIMKTHFFNYFYLSKSADTTLSLIHDISNDNFHPRKNASCFLKRRAVLRSSCRRLDSSFFETSQVDTGGSQRPCYSTSQRDQRRRKQRGRARNCPGTESDCLQKL